MIWPFHRKATTETGAKYYIRDAAMADAKRLVDFKHRRWREMFAHLKTEEFFAKAEATTEEQTKFWQSRIAKGDKVWIAEDLHDQFVGTIHATTNYSEHTAEFIELYELGAPHEIRFFYLAEQAAGTTIGQELLRVAVADEPAIAWVMGEAPLVQASLTAAGFEPLGEPVEPSDEPWRGVPRQAMVRP